MHRPTRRTALSVPALLGAAAAYNPGDAIAEQRLRRRSAGRIAVTQPVVRTRQGFARGFTDTGVNVFRGIPYAAPPTGALRFQPPAQPPSWEGERDFLAYGMQCPVGPPDAPQTSGSQQDAFLLYRGWTPHRSSEDCLVLNVWAPQGEGRRPVLVYMHGGGLFAGSGNDLLAYDGANLARSGDAVVVTHNHRLNIFGYLDLSTFGGQWSNSVNLGLQDIVAVLEWVRDNIAAFGGDPDNVTIFGQSGGGFKVQGLMRMPSARGLFHKAIVQSGVLWNTSSITPDLSRSNTEEVLRQLHITGGSLESLQTLTLGQLGQAAVAGSILRWSVVCDGAVVSEPLDVRVPSSISHGIPLLVGSNLAELSNAVDQPEAGHFSESDLLRAASRDAGAAAQEIVAAYREEYPNLPPYELWCAMRAAQVRDASFALADTKYAADGQVWQYLFNWRTPMLGGTPGCFHSAEIAFVFDNADLCVNQTGGGQEALDLATRVSRAWIAFARSGNPNHAGLPRWPRFDASHPVMVFDDVCRVRCDPEALGRTLIRQSSPDRAP